MMLSDNTLDSLASIHPNTYLHGELPMLPSQQPIPPFGRAPDGRTIIMDMNMGQDHHRQRRRDSRSAEDDSGRSSSADSTSSPVGHFGPCSSVDDASSASASSSRVVQIVGPSETALSSSAAATAAKAKRKRSMIACRNCNERRVRCDGSITGLPCTTCKSAGKTDCAFIDSKRVRGKRGRFESRDKLGSQPDAQYPGDPQYMALTRSPKLRSSIPQSLSYSVFPPTSPAGYYQNMPYNSHLRSSIHGNLQVGGSRKQSSIAENHIWRRLFESQPGVPQTQRITYVGEAWHLSWVLHQKTGSAPLHFSSPVVEDSPEPPPVRRITAAASGAPGIPSPGTSRVAQLVSAIMGGEGSHAQAAAAAVQASIDAFVVPPAPIRDALIDAYFSHFHPFFPILSRERFQNHLNCSMTNKSPSLLLLQSMLMIGAMHCPLPLLTTPLPAHSDWKPFPNRSTAIETLVHRARTLFNIDHEKDRLSVIQSMFLLQFWWRIPTDYKDQSYWMAGAIRIAQGMGLHRSTRENWAKGILSDEERLLWRKMWWALWIRDRQIAAAMGKPVLIHDEDCDVEELGLRDFAGEKRETALFMLETVRLTRVLHEILKCEFTPTPAGENSKAGDLHGPGGGAGMLPSDRALRRERCQKMLEDWQRALPLELSGEDLPANPSSVGKGSNRLCKRLMQLLFKIYFQSYELLLHRPMIYKRPDRSTSAPSPGGAPPESPAYVPPASSRQPPAPIASHAAKAITQYGQEVHALCGGDVRFLPLNYVSFLFAALSVQVVELQSVRVEEAPEKERTVRGYINFNLESLERLTDMYPIAGWCRKLLAKILDETEAAGGAGDGDIAVAAAAAAEKRPNRPKRRMNDGELERPVMAVSAVTSLATTTTTTTNNTFSRNADLDAGGPAYPENPYNTSHTTGILPPHHPTTGFIDHRAADLSGTAAYRIYNVNPHYNPHAYYHNLAYSHQPQPQPHDHLSLSSLSSSPSPSPSPLPPGPGSYPAHATPAFNPFDLSPLEAHSHRLRSLGLGLGIPVPSLSPTPSAEAAATLTRTPSDRDSADAEAEAKTLARKWAGDVLLDPDLLQLSAGAMSDHGSTPGAPGDQEQHHVHHGGRVVGEVVDEEEEDVPIPGSGPIPRLQHGHGHGHGHQVYSENGNVNMNLSRTYQYPPPPPPAAQNQGQWIFDGAGVLLGNPFLQQLGGGGSGAGVAGVGPGVGSGPGPGAS